MKRIYSILLDANSIIGRIICGMIYIFFYDYIYENFIFGVFGYMAEVDYVPMNIATRLLWILVSITPLLFYHRITKISTFICLFLYLFTYIPFIHAMFITDRISPLMTYSYSLVMCIFFSLYFKLDHFSDSSSKLIFKPTIPLVVIEITTLILTLIFIGTRASSMHFVNILTQQDILYDLRAQNSEKVEAQSLILYLQGWLVGAFYPFLLVYYLRQKERIKTALIFLGYIALFMVDMQKSTFVTPFILIGMYYLLLVKEEVICNRLHSYIILFISAISIILYLITDIDNKILFSIVSILLLRTICVTGWLTQMYALFFQENPYTYYSHINIVNAITNQYPYDAPLGVAVAHGGMNANATFFLTDGLAAWGLGGIIVIGAVFLLLIYVINMLSYRYKNTDLFVVFIPTVIFLLNASLFTTLLTGGLLILILIIGGAEQTAEREDIAEESSEI